MKRFARPSLNEPNMRAFPFIPLAMAVALALTQGPAAGAQDRVADRTMVYQQGQMIARGGNFDLIELYEKGLLLRRSRTEDGAFALHYFHAGIESFLGSMEGKDCRYDTKDFFARWSKAFPDSALMHTMYAATLSYEAHCLRGSDAADHVKPEVWPVFRQKLDEAASYLTAHKKDSDIEPEWYVQMEGISLDQNWSSDDFLNMVEEGAHKFPAYHDIYETAAVYFLPRYSGENGQLDHFLKWADGVSEPFEGSRAMYMRAFRHVMDSLGHDPLEGTGFSWLEFSEGMSSIYAHYPSDRNRMSFLRYACLAGDRATAQKYRRDALDSAFTSPWRSKAEFAQCKMFTQGLSQNHPSFAEYGAGG